MLSIEQARKIEPELSSLSDEEVLVMLKDIYGLCEMAYEKWHKEVFQKSH